MVCAWRGKPGVFRTIIRLENGIWTMCGIISPVTRTHLAWRAPPDPGVGVRGALGAAFTEVACLRPPRSCRSCARRRSPTRHDRAAEQRPVLVPAHLRAWSRCVPKPPSEPRHRRIVGREGVVAARSRRCGPATDPVASREPSPHGLLRGARADRMPIADSAAASSN